MQSKLFFYGFIGTFFFASLAETVFSKERLTTSDQGTYPNIQQSVLKSFWLLQFDNLIKREQTNQIPKQPFQNTPSKAKSRKMFTETKSSRQKASDNLSSTFSPITMFMCGDVMLGRGIDQVLTHPSDPVLHEPYMKSAIGYVELAERVNGPIPYPVSYSYIWGDALEELERVAPDLRLINLETSITKSNDYLENKGIHYRMHPKNIDCITAAKIDYCSLANNHLLDWGYSGLKETLETLQKVNVKSAGAGQNLQEAETPAVMEVEGKGRVIVFSYGLVTSGISPGWDALKERPGVNLLKDLSKKTMQRIKEKVKEVKQQGDIVVVSIHWGDNWGYEIPSEQREFAHKLIDGMGVDVIHGHSSHHVKGIEVYKDKLIIYGCGDFLNDYEGIGGYEDFRADLALMYFVSVEPSSGKLIRLQMTPTQIKNFKVNRASKADSLWLRDILNRESKRFGTQVKLSKDYVLTLQWN
ncbi:MAG: poly-gamma-glutamate synthesis protein [Candidatus Scalindua rubra]|uniref:Poly-gamma-glutamate synthesis protein n=1 Tax=Candidatus Scalindua rubra TaxID=1872076 RepID=A0A1E3X3V7_9BACT|nr:MAG: poly-gamma-glutamate synthesis protein [Candidatus Scalindua rubra]